MIQSILAGSKVIKAFNQITSEYMIKGDVFGERMTMLICGNDQAAKQEVGQILDQFNWNSLDLGAINQAYLIEAFAMTWIVCGGKLGSWKHGFLLMKQ
jgi:hypothetical protein